jgi:transketolase
VGARGRHIGVDEFGMSAPESEIFKAMGITTDAVVATARDVLFGVRGRK